MKVLNLNVPAMSRVTVTMQYIIVSNKTRVPSCIEGAIRSRLMSQTDDDAAALPVDGYTVCRDRTPAGGPNWMVTDIAARLRQIGDEMNADYTFTNPMCSCNGAGAAVERILKMVPFLKYVSETLDGQV